MNTKTMTRAIAGAAVLAALFFSACQLPSMLSGSRSGKGTLQVKINAVSPVVSGFLQNQGGRLAPSPKGQSTLFASSSTARGRRVSLSTSNQTSAFAPRAYLAANSVELILKDSSGNTVERMTEQIGTDITTQINTNGAVALYPSNLNIVPGSNYTLSAEIFNTDVSSSYPVASGTSAAFSITQGATQYVTISCLPDNPQTLSTGSGSTAALTPWVIASDGSVSSTGGEEWYEVTLTGSASYLASFTPSLSTVASAFVFDSSGNLLSDGTSSAYGAPADVGIFPSGGGTFYIGVINEVGSSGSTSPQGVTASLTTGVVAPSVYVYDVNPNATYTSTVNWQDQDVTLEWTWPGPSSSVTWVVQRSTSPSFTSPTTVYSPSIQLTNGAASLTNAAPTYDSSTGLYSFDDYSAPMNGTTYYYEVTATDTASGGGTSAASAAATTWSAPSSPYAVESPSTSGSVNLYWGSVSGASGYYVTVYDSSATEVYYGYASGTSASIPSSYFVGGTTYYFQVQAYGSAGYYGYLGGNNFVYN